MMRRPRFGLLALARAAWHLFLAAGFARLFCCSEAAYTCDSGDVVGEVQGETGSVCTTRCSDGSFDCPTGVPAGTTAQPQCVLQDVNQAAYCGLLCQVDAQCPSGAACKKVGSAAAGTPEVSLCIHPLSFREWASGQASRQKLVVGFPAKGAAGQSARGFQLAKAYAALQSLKRRYGMADGDGDVLTVKELLSAASVAGMKAAGGAAPAAQAPAQAQVQATVAAAQPQPQPSAGSGGPVGAWRRDMNYFAGNMEQGLPGVQREVQDTVWNLEHLDHTGVCSTLLRGVLMAAAVYLVGGSLYKNQALGASGLDMIPHIGFWMEYPSLVHDGVRYAASFCSDLLSSGGPVGLLMGSHDEASGAGGVFGRRRGPDRDTFANFEPMK